MKSQVNLASNQSVCIENVNMKKIYVHVLRSIRVKITIRQAYHIGTYFYKGEDHHQAAYHIGTYFHKGEYHHQAGLSHRYLLP